MHNTGIVLTYIIVDEISITGGITIGFEIHAGNVTEFSRATIVRIVPNSKRLAEGKWFAAPAKRYGSSRMCDIIYWHYDKNIISL